ncbi:hypothetical protein [Alkaliphilus hydrothermalis]|uniref:HTH domain-containing protein n=1 Tax=Alkaliphilus hydrothermalis TaxID=1482730 RepID=A0ABS2NRM6_9FIRM|nr:hypothetical protein [Alkaliphilus hydrothermalis]MBM7615603.1 hypothetical protein [Alkaliphilus hydrothermalis]
MKGTLAWEIRKLYENSRKNGGVKKEDYENLVSFFENYYGGKTRDRETLEVLDISMMDLLRDESEFMFNVLQGVKSYPNDKCKLSKRLEVFLAHLKIKYGFNYSDNIFENFKVNDKNQRILLMLKYLHSGEKSRSDIAEDFGISERTVAEDLSILQNGFTFLGTEMNIRGLERGTNKYKSIIHPIFLAANSAEIYALTVGLKLLSKGTVFEESLGRISNVIYEQLSENSKRMIDQHEDEIVTFDNGSLKFIDSSRLVQMIETPFAYFLKDPVECIITYREEGRQVKYIGTLKLARASKGNIYNKVILENNEETIILDMENILSIRRVDEDIYFEDR